MAYVFIVLALRAGEALRSPFPERSFAALRMTQV
jgi:hypothetical protein